MSQPKSIQEAIQEWNCLGYYGYGHGAGLKVFNVKDVCSDICPMREACWEKHKQRINEQFPVLAKVRAKAVELAESQHRPYQNSDYTNLISKELGREPLPQEGLDPLLADNAKNIARGLKLLPPDGDENGG